LRGKLGVLAKELWVTFSTRPTLYGVLVSDPAQATAGSTVPAGTTHTSSPYAESSVDDLGTCRGVVLSRAATILRSIETQP
jgi:hypothetical protein